MKRILCLLILLQFLSLRILAQCTTRQYSPEWDWRGSGNYTFITGDQNSQPVTIVCEPPWFAVNRNNANINSFRLQNPKDYEPTDGWVLVQRDFGSISSPVNNPYFILYNKFSGILRIFVAVTKVFGQNNSAVISLTYKDGTANTADGSNTLVRSAILENHTKNSYRSALDDFDNQVLPINVPNVYSNDLPYWLHADFTIDYDPCICKNLSQLVFEANLILTSDLAFAINGTAVQGLDATGNSSSGKQSLAKSVQGIVDAGNSFYKSAEDGISTFNKIFPNLAKKSDVAALEKIIPGLGAAAGVVDFLSGLFGGSAAQPISYDINLKSSGNITTSFPYKSVIFENSGSANLSLIPPTKLNYNSPMGVFKLIETPSVISSSVFTGDINPPPYTRMYLKYKLTSGLLYVINPEPQFDLNQSEIKFALIFEFDPTSFQGLNDPSGNLVDDGIINGKQVFRTKYIPTSCSSDLSVFLDLPRPGGSPIVPDVYLKIIATLKKDGKNFVYISKYKVSLTVDNSKFNQSSFWPSSLLNISNDLIFQNTTVTSGVSTWNTITFGDGAIAQPSSPVTFTAGNSISVTAGATIKANSTLKIGTPNGCLSAISQGDPSILCNSTSNIYYSKSHAYAREKAEEVDSLKLKTSESSFTLFPNPAANRVTFRYTVDLPSYVEIKLTDLSERLIDTPLKDYQETGVYEQIFDTSALPSGVYIVIFVSNTNKEIRRMMILR